MRIKIFRIIIVGLFFLIAINLFYVQVIRGRYFYNLSTNNRIRVVPLEGERGRIYDRNGILLADNRLSFNVLVIPQEIQKSGEVFAFLSKILGIEGERLEKIYRQRMFSPFSPVVVAENIPQDQAIIIEENKFRIPGLLIQEGFRRFYPNPTETAHVLGYVGKISVEKMEELQEYGYSSLSMIGYSGIEEFYDRNLKGQEGGIQIEVNSRGQQVRQLGLKEAVKGEDLVLTVDQRIQKIATELLTGHQGSIIVMDIENGEILGLTSAPTYDPNVFVQNLQQETGELFSDPASPLLNRAIGGQYPPGSVFKIPVGICALDSGKINRHTTFHCPGSYKLGDREFRCTHVHGSQDLIQAIGHSCNVYFFHVGLMAGPELIERYAKNLGLGSETGIDLPYEAKGFVPGREKKKVKKFSWYKGDTLNLAIGQGDLLATPLQLVRMMATVAHDGYAVRPHVVMTVGSVKWNENSRSSRLPLEPTTLKAIHDGMESTVVMSTGTAHLLDIPGIKVAGKTGTAQSSGVTEHHAWFVGYGISDHAKIAFCVFLEHGGSSYNAVVLAKDLLMRMQAEKIL